MIHVSFSAIAALFAGLLGVMVLCFFLGERRRAQHRLLIYFLLVLIFIQVHSFSLHSGLMLHFPWLLNINIPLVFLLGPLLYSYSRHIRKEGMSKKEWSYHMVPFVFVLSYCFNFYLQGSAYKYNIILNAISADIPVQPYIKTFPSDPWNLNGWIVVELQCLHLFAYGLWTFLGLQRSKVQSHWLTLLNLSLIAASVILFLTEGGVINGKRFLSNLLPELSNPLFAGIVLYAIAIYLILRPAALTRHLPKYQKSSLNEDWRKKKAQDLQVVLERDKLYLRADLSLQLVADVVGIKKHHLSQVINQELGCTFFELVNRLRIKEARQVLSQEEDCKMEMLAYQLGYRSKSAFFNAFKKETSQTPGQFVRSM